jgi:hypothetical protein
MGLDAIKLSSLGSENKNINRTNDADSARGRLSFAEGKRRPCRKIAGAQSSSRCRSSKLLRRRFASDCFRRTATISASRKPTRRNGLILRQRQARSIGVPPCDALRWIRAQQVEHRRQRGRIWSRRTSRRVGPYRNTVRLSSSAKRRRYPLGTPPVQWRPLHCKWRGDCVNRSLTVSRR